MNNENKTLADAIETLQCAEINCNNALKTGGVAFVPLVKYQIAEAIKILESIGDQG